MKLKNSKQLASLLIVFCVVGAGAAYVVASDGATASINVPLTITGPDGVCKIITNNSGTSLTEYVPTASVAEWQSFVVHPPAGVSLNACVSPCSSRAISKVWYTGGAYSQTEAGSLPNTPGGTVYQEDANYLWIIFTTRLKCSNGTWVGDGVPYEIFGPGSGEILVCPANAPLPVTCSCSNCTGPGNYMIYQ